MTNDKGEHINNLSSDDISTKFEIVGAIEFVAKY